MSTCVLIRVLIMCINMGVLTCIDICVLPLLSSAFPALRSRQQDEW